MRDATKCPVHHKHVYCALPVGHEGRHDSGSIAWPQTECISCPEGLAQAECPLSQRPCGHHCNCSWTQDRCHWCGASFGAGDEPFSPIGMVVRDNERHDWVLTATGWERTPITPIT